MKRKLETSELIFKVFSYFFLTLFALICLYPFIYVISSAISEKTAVEYNQIIILPHGIQFHAFADILLNDGRFWTSYANTLYVTFYGTIFSLVVSIIGAYALSKPRLMFKKGFNFILVFTMWFSAGVVPQFKNYESTRKIFDSIANAIWGLQTGDDKVLIVVAMGMAAMNIILLRNAFEGVPKEIEEAAIVDGATEGQILTKVFIPMSKSTIATVGLFFGVSRWNGYFWAQRMTRDPNDWPLQVYIKDTLNYALGVTDPDFPGFSTLYADNSLVYAMVICAIIPILIIYPYIQKYFAKGVNMGGVKE